MIFVDMIFFRSFYVTLATANMFCRNLYYMFLIYYLVKSSESRQKDPILTLQNLTNVTK